MNKETIFPLQNKRKGCKNLAVENFLWSSPKKAHESNRGCVRGDLHSPSLEDIQRELVDEGRETGPRYAQSTATQKEGTRTRRIRKCAKRGDPALVHSCTLDSCVANATRTRSAIVDS